MPDGIRYKLARMLFGPGRSGSGRLSNAAARSAAFLLFALQFLPSASLAALPRRLILALDGVSYRDMKALQEGVTYKDLKGRRFHRQAFNEGYFPVSRNVSTFPSTSDVAWTEVFGDRPLPGYQRTYYSTAANSEIVENGVTTSMEHERQMQWQVESGLRRAMGYVFPLRTFQYEVHELIEHFLSTETTNNNFYAYVRSTDDAQHLSGDIFAMLCELDGKLQELRARYKAREGRDLEILILSDHGNNHAGAGKRVDVRSFLRRAGCRIARSIVSSQDVVLPTVGIESWVEIHNSPSETERLLQLLWHMKGVDVLMARAPGHAGRFIVMNSKGERAVIDWNSAKDSFRYSPENGDPIGYRPVVEALAAKNQLDSDGFAPDAAWVAATLAHHYPLALQRIVRGLTRVTLNPATILISLNNDYVNSGWLVKHGSELVTFGGTHGGLDDINSDGILLSNFTPTKDTSTRGVAGLFDGFPGLRDYRAEEDGAEWVSVGEQALTRIARESFDREYGLLPSDEIFLRVWTPRFTHLDIDAPVEVTMQKVPHFSNPQRRRWDPERIDASERNLTLRLPVSMPGQSPYERVYAFPRDLILEPEKTYRISGRINDGKEKVPIFEFAFRTDSHGMPVVY
jgi:hypothetical protein